MKTLFVAAALLFSLIIHAQKTPKTQEEMEAFLKDMQRKADSMQNVAKKKGIRYE